MADRDLCDGVYNDTEENYEIIRVLRIMFSQQPGDDSAYFVPAITSNIQRMYYYKG
jgi:hypothetical protein